MHFPFWLKGFLAAISPARAHESDRGRFLLPEKLPWRDLLLAREEEDQWSVGMRCPCGCGQRLELMLLKQVKPRWDLTTDTKGRPTLSPSVWLRTGCRSHFWVRGGKIIWCE